MRIKKIIIDTITRRGDEIYKHLLDSRFTILPYDSLNEICWQTLGETAIAFISDIPQAKDWLQYAMTIFFTTSPVWSDNQGGWHEGISDWQRNLDERLWWLDIIKSAFSIDGFRKPFFKKTGDYALYTCPVNAKHGGFGDEADSYSVSKNGMVMGLLATKTNNPYWLWYAAKVSPQLQGEDISYRDMLRAVNPTLEGMAPSALPNSKIFEDTGVAAFHSSLSYPEGDTCLLFKSSPFGTQGHGYNAQNSFMLFYYGEPVLLPSGHKDWYGSPYQEKGMWESFSENTITVNGIGQIKHSPLARGKILHQLLSKQIDYVAGDASQAYGDSVSKFVRHIFFVKPSIVVMMDELESPQCATFEYHLHANEPFEIKSQKLITAKSKDARVEISFATPTDLDIRQVTGFSISGAGGNSEQSHLVATPKTPSKKARFVSAFLTHDVSSHSPIGTTSTVFGGNEAFAVNSQMMSIALISNPERIRKKFGLVETDAEWLLIVEKYTSENDVTFLGVNAAFFGFNNKTLRDMKSPGEMLISKEELTYPAEPVTKQDQSKPADGGVKDPSGKMSIYLSCITNSWYAGEDETAGKVGVSPASVDFHIQMQAGRLLYP